MTKLDPIGQPPRLYPQSQWLWSDTNGWHCASCGVTVGTDKNACPDQMHCRCPWEVPSKLYMATARYPNDDLATFIANSEDAARMLLQERSVPGMGKVHVFIFIRI